MTVRWGELTSAEIAAETEAGAIVLLPLGCTEQHAGHLPVDTDTYQVERAATEAAIRAGERHDVRVLVLPPLSFGPASEHHGMPGTISLSSETYVQILKQIVWSVIESGFRRVVVLRGCGGHWVAPGALWDLKAEARRAGIDVTLRLVGVSDGWGEIQERVFPNTDGGHAAVMETALCLAGREHLVRRDAMRGPQLDDLQGRYLDGGEVFLFDEMTDTGALGDPSPATVEGGEAAWEAIIDGLAARLARFEAHDRART